MSKSDANSTNGTAAGAARALAPHARIEQRLGRSATADIACAELSRIFNVAALEVALLRLEKDILNFLFPGELSSAGFIPLSSSSAVAARTANTRKIELFNKFLIVQHANIFETIKLSTATQPNAPGANTIQKLMSTPVIDADGIVLGVIQVCHKGLTPESSGPDFTLNDLQNRESVAKIVAKLPFMNPVA